MKNKIGISLFIAYFIQYFFALKWTYLENLQAIELYKKWSGFVLLLLILSQWYLSIIRMNKSNNADKKELFIELHKWIGVLLPIGLYFHSTNIGFGILMLLTIIFYINLIIGFINTDKILDNYPQFFNWWLFAHIIFSVAVLIFSFIHVWLVFFYN